MSITFYVSTTVDDHTRQVHHCDCNERWQRDYEIARQRDVPLSDYPTPYSCDRCVEAEMNLANMNAADLLRWLDLPVEPCGTIKATELAARCRRRLWDEPRNHDPKVTAIEWSERTGVVSDRVIFSERDSDYLRTRTEQLLKICELAGDCDISWA